MSGSRPPRRTTFKKRPPRRGPRPAGGKSFERPRIDPQLKKVFKQIGVPSAEPFTPDPFQLDALEWIREKDVIVSAPTGAGKTWIAVEEIRRCLLQGRKVWYASPLKALSNAIYLQFQDEFGAGRCGILTGDRKENPDASIIVGTTEILRNQLYDAMHRGMSIGTDLVILDEAHYLSDPDRGVVWEETLIYLPPRVRLLLLSATIPNAEAVAAWFEEIRKAPACVVKTDQRPVPLEMLFLLPDGLAVPLGTRKGISSKVGKFMTETRAKRTGERRRALAHNYGDVIRCLRSLDLLPAIFFLKSRADCDNALNSCPSSGQPPEPKRRLRAQVSAFLSEHPHLRRNRQVRPLREALVAAHHAGQLPSWKLLVEKMMQKGLLEAIFSTSTVAAGVNFPARSVVLVQSDRFDGREFRDLTARDLHQMIGRAGRRGKDRIGFGIVLPGVHQDPALINALSHAPPEPLVSRIHINFSMTLNLLLSHTPEDVRTLLDLSFAAFQRGGLDSGMIEAWEGLLDSLAGELSGGKCDVRDPYEVLELIESRERTRRRLRALEQDRRFREKKRTYGDLLTPGRLFLHKKGDVHVVFGKTEEDGRTIYESLNLERPIRTKGKRVRLRKVRLERVKFLFDLVVEVPGDWTRGAVQGMIDRMPPVDLKVLDPGSEEPEAEGGAGAVAPEIPCETCPHFKDCHTLKNRRVQHLLREIRSLGARLEGLSEGLWLSFKKHLRFLKDTGFVDGEDHLTDDGEWASKLRLDHPLLIADAIRRGALDGISSDLLAGVIAPFVWDRTVEVLPRLDNTVDLDGLERRFERVLETIEGIRALKASRGFANPAILFWPAVALTLWAGQTPWERLLEVVPVDEGDMASLIVRTADHLRQVAGLRETHGELARKAEEAVERILREPAFFE